MASGTEHDSGIREQQPATVEAPEVGHEVTDEPIVAAGHHEADGEAGRVGGGGNKVEAAEGAEAALTLEVHIEDDAF